MISSVSTSKSKLTNVGGTVNFLADPSFDGHYRIALTNSTTVTATRDATHKDGAMTISFEVVEFK